MLSKRIMISSYCHRLFCQNLILFLWQIVWIKHFQSEKQIGCNKNWLEFEENQMKVLQQKIELMRFLLSLFWMCNAILLTLLGRCLIENNILPSADNGLVLVQTGKYYSSGVDWSQLLFEIYLEIIHQGKDAIRFMLFDTLFVGKCSFFFPRRGCIDLHTVITPLP